MSGGGLQVVASLAVITFAGLTMLAAGMAKRQLGWRTVPRERRKRTRR